MKNSTENSCLWPQSGGVDLYLELSLLLVSFIMKMDEFLKHFSLTGFTNIVGICLTFLYYLSNLEAVSLNLIIVLFSVAMLLFANSILMFAGVKGNHQFIIPWLAITAVAMLGAIIYCIISWEELIQFRVSIEQ